MTTQILEGTWEEVAQQSEKLRGRKVRITILNDESLPKPNQKMLDVIKKVSENQRNRNETFGESGVDIIRRGRAGEMFNNGSD